MNSSIKLSEAVSIGMLACAHIAANNGRRIAVREIATMLNASPGHLSKVMGNLCKQGLVHSITGPRGGMILTRPPERIHLIEIFQAIVGNNPTFECLVSKQSCSGPTCLLGGILDEVNKTLTTYLSQHTLADLIARHCRNCKGFALDGSHLCAART